jgi:hypothetical protein
VISMKKVNMKEIHLCSYHYNDVTNELISEILNNLMNSQLDIQIIVDKCKYSKSCNGYHRLRVIYKGINFDVFAWPVDGQDTNIIRLR